MKTSDSQSNSDSLPASPTATNLAGQQPQKSNSLLSILSLGFGVAGLLAAGYFWNEANSLKRAALAPQREQIESANSPAGESASDALLVGIEELARESAGESVAWTALFDKLEKVASNLPPSNEQAAVFIRLAAVQKSRGKYRNAVVLSRRALDALEGDASAGDRLSVRAELAFNLLLVGDIPQGSDLINELLLEAESTLPEEDPLRLAILNACANVDFMKGEIDSGLEKARRAMKGREGKLQEDNPNLIFAINSLAMVSAADQKIGNAIKYFQQLTDLWDQRNPKHVAALAARSQLASLLQRVEGAQQQSAEAMADVFERTKLARGTKDAQTLQLAANYVQALLGAEEYEKAMEVAEVAAADAKEVLGESHPIAIANCRGLALAHHFLGDSQRAIPLIKSVLQSLENSVGKEDERYLQSMSDLAVIQFGAGDIESGNETVRAALQACRETLGNDHQRTQTLTLALAKKLEEQQIFSEASELYLSHFNWRKDNLPTIDAAALGAGAKAAMMYRLAGKPNKAIESLEEVGPRAKETLGNNNSITLLTNVLLSRAKIDLGQLEEASEVISETLELSKTILGDTHGVTNDARAANFALQMARGQFSAAEETALYLLEQVKDAPSTNSLRLTLAANMIAEAKLRTGDNTGATQLLTAIIASIEEQFANHTLVANSHVLLGEAKLAQGDSTAAEEHLLLGESTLRRTSGELTPEDKKRLTQARKLLVNLYEAKGDQDRADEFRD